MKYDRYHRKMIFKVICIVNRVTLGAGRLHLRLLPTDSRANMIQAFMLICRSLPTKWKLPYRTSSNALGTRLKCLARNIQRTPNMNMTSARNPKQA